MSNRRGVERGSAGHTYAANTSDNDLAMYTFWRDCSSPHENMILICYLVAQDDVSTHLQIDVKLAFSIRIYIEY